MSRGEGNTNGLSPLARRSRMHLARELRGTLLGPVLVSVSTTVSSRTSDQRSPTISFPRQPVSRRSRTISACGRSLFRVWRSSASCRQAISSRDRKRVSLGRRLSRMPCAGFFSMCLRAIAEFMIWRRSANPLFAPPGAVRLRASNHFLTSSEAMWSSCTGVPQSKSHLLQPLRLQPAGATVARRGSHPLSDDAFARRMIYRAKIPSLRIPKRLYRKRCQTKQIDETKCLNEKPVDQTLLAFLGQRQSCLDAGSLDGLDGIPKLPKTAHKSIPIFETIRHLSANSLQ